MRENRTERIFLFFFVFVLVGGGGGTILEFSSFSVNRVKQIYVSFPNDSQVGSRQIG